MKALLATALLCLPAWAAEPLKLAWDEYDEASEGTVGFYLHFGREPGEYTVKVKVEDPAAQSAVVDTLQPGRWYSSVTAFAVLGGNLGGAEIESEHSNEITFILRPKKLKNYRKE